MSNSTDCDAPDMARLREVERTALLAAARQILERADFFERAMGPNAVPVSTIRRILAPWVTASAEGDPS